MSFMKYKLGAGLFKSEDELSEYNIRVAINNYKEVYHKASPTREDIYECKKAQGIILMAIARGKYTLTKVD